MNSLVQMQPRLQAATERLAREWAVVFAELYRVKLQDRGPRFVNVWVGALSDLAPEVLDAACKRTIQTCKFFPTPAEIRAHIDRADTNANDASAEKAWQRVLELRRLYWNADMPGGFSRGMPKLDERTAQAARAAGVWREFTAAEFESGALHTWAKKKFVDSFVAWGELKRDEFLLPPGEVRDLIEDTAQKLLPSPTTYEEGRARGIAWTEEIKAKRNNDYTLRPIANSVEPYTVFATPERLALLEKQKAEITSKFASGCDSQSGESRKRA
jgi:hypothetical protein